MKDTVVVNGQSNIKSSDVVIKFTGTKFYCYQLQVCSVIRVNKVISGCAKLIIAYLCRYIMLKVLSFFRCLSKENCITLKNVKHASILVQRKLHL